MSRSTAAFIFRIASSLSFALTAFSVCAKAGPCAVRIFWLTTGAAFWKPKTFFGSVSTTYFEPCSWPSVVNTSAVSTLPVSSALYWRPIDSGLSLSVRPYSDFSPFRPSKRVANSGGAPTVTEPLGSFARSATDLRLFFCA